MDLPDAQLPHHRLRPRSAPGMTVLEKSESHPVSLRFGILSCVSALRSCARHPSEQAADNAAIKEKAAVCSGCHGENGISQTENIPSLAGQPGSIPPVAARVLPRRLAQERPDAADRRGDHQRGHPQSRRLFRLVDAAEGPRRTTTPICRRKARRSPSAAAAPHATPTAMPAPRPWRGLPVSARNIWLRRCTTTRRRQRVGGGGAAMADVAYSLSEEEITAASRTISRICSSGAVRVTSNAVRRPGEGRGPIATGSCLAKTRMADDCTTSCGSCGPGSRACACPGRRR